MPMHFPTVPVEAAPREALLRDCDHLRPLALVVDDDPLITETLAAILQGSGLTAMTAADGFAALELASLIPPEIVITDIAMPGMSGLDMAVELARAVPDCDFILFSSQTATADVAGRMRNSGVNFITMAKPVHPADLLDAIFELLGRRRRHSLMLPKPFRRPSLYDFLFSAQDSKTASGAPTITRRLRARPSQYYA